MEVNGGLDYNGHKSLHTEKDRHKSFCRYCGEIRVFCQGEAQLSGSVDLPQPHQRGSCRKSHVESLWERTCCMCLSAYILDKIDQRTKTCEPCKELSRETEPCRTLLQKMTDHQG